MPRFDFGTPFQSPIEKITNVWRLRTPPHHRWKGPSLPGHLIHLFISGSVVLRINERSYNIVPNDIVYYYESEDVEWLDTKGRVVYYSVLFVAPRLEPPPTERRVVRSTAAIRKAFNRLYAVSQRPHSLSRVLGSLAALHDLLYLMAQKNLFSSALEDRGEMWWKLEEAIRRRRLFRPTLTQLCDIACTSRATLVRACQKATGTSPMRRIRLLRMEEARGLLACSQLSVTQIAEYLGYSRIHEFSREFASVFGEPPSIFRTRVR